ncbi:hypothetical protein ZIOFF_060303 [Zingiber officinale]|uniref:Uncharacterized protein n=1 Tax=Zingiber officinale TaxID=94328 RepID=A0A8J5FEF9_ZINOF|nr:hypothetical protein ZIOFF_060303 [Zingiber officinale]
MTVTELSHSMAHKTTAAMTSLNGGTAFHSLHVSRFATLLFRAHALLYSFALFALLLHHFLYPSSVLLLAADLVLSFLWASAVPFRWCPVRRKEFPDSLLREVGRDDLPAIDVFVCTADPRREPPASVASTALSAMAFDYPTDRLSVYLSDDGGSAVTLFAFMEAARFARYWLPFCKENAVVKRSPEVYFEEESSDEAGSKNLKHFHSPPAFSFLVSELEYKLSIVKKKFYSRGKFQSTTTKLNAIHRHRHPLTPFQWLDWVIRPTQIYLHLQPMEVNSHTLMDGRILISFSNDTATRDNQPPYYNSHDEEIQSEGGEIIVVLTEKHPSIDICLGYEEDYSEIPAAATDKEDYPYILLDDDDVVAIWWRHIRQHPVEEAGGGEGESTQLLAVDRLRERGRKGSGSAVVAQCRRDQKSMAMRSRR